MFTRTGFLMAAMLVSQVAIADIKVAQLHVEDAKLVGDARLKVMFWSVFDARLYAEGGVFNQLEPFALSLSYLRKLKGEQIISKTIEEMMDQKKFDKQELADWSVQLSSIIKDVNASTTITGVRDERGYTLFYRNGKPAGTIENTRFTEGFFDIWLGENTSEPQLRRNLLSAGKS